MKFIKYWLPVIVWMGAIFYFSSRHSVEISPVYLIQFLFFKTLHVIEYGILFTLFYRALRNTWKMIDWKNKINAWVLTSAYGITDEIHQLFVPSREGRIRDVAIDMIGITIAFLIIWKILPKAPKILKSWAKILQII